MKKDKFVNVDTDSIPKDAKNSDSSKKKFVKPPEFRIHKLQELFEAFSVAAEETYVYICDMKYDYSLWSKEAVEFFCLPSQYMFEAGKVWEDHLHEDDREKYREKIREVFEGRRERHEAQYRARRCDGEYEVCTCRGRVLKDADGSMDFFVGIIRNHGLHGHVDSLTGLKNLYGFFEDVQLWLKRGMPLTISMVGISKFSEINEIYGYRFGNRVLQKVTRFLLDHVDSSVNVYRLDGTKFAFMGERISDVQVRQLYENARSFFRNSFFLDDKCIAMDINGGLLQIDRYDLDHQTIYSCLNFAYTESKLKRQGHLVEFNDQIGNTGVNRIERLNAIRSSMARGNKGFYLVYQPVVDAQRENIIGAEALIRWKNDDYGEVSPNLFIPVLESDPLFPSLGRWILKTAIEDAKRMIEIIPNFVIDVNLSYSQIERPDFLDMVKDVLEETDFPPEKLCLKITERCRLLDMDMLKNAVMDLRSKGIRIAIDDFGTGFSSVGLLKDFPVDIIKVDRSFVMHVEQDEIEQALVEHFSSLAYIVGAKVCVEGVETCSMKELLKNYRVHSFQGYYYAKPLIREDFLLMEKRYDSQPVIDRSRNK